MDIDLAASRLADQFGDFRHAIPSFVPFPPSPTTASIHPGPQGESAIDGGSGRRAENIPGPGFCRAFCWREWPMFGPRRGGHAGDSAHERLG